MSEILKPSFFHREVLEVAPQLLGKRLVRCIDGVRISGVIIETEAYRGEEDQACHARVGMTPRTRVMYGPAGRAYVYFTYGMHWMLNCVCGEEGYPAAILIRAIQPAEGLEQIAQRRGKVKEALWCNGPAKLTQALAIDGNLNSVDLCSQESGLWIEDGDLFTADSIRVAPRIGIQSVPEPWLSKLWNYSLVIN
ncbi:MAG: DNA-3-methyladenine glycosylase [Anaerolineaceae bacterium]